MGGQPHWPAINTLRRYTVNTLSDTLSGQPNLQSLPLHYMPQWSAFLACLTGRALAWQMPPSVVGMFNGNALTAYCHGRANVIQSVVLSRSGLVCQ